MVVAARAVRSASSVASTDLSTATPESPVRLGRYDVTGRLGAGGMGTVHDAIDREHGTRVALKTLNHLSPANLLLFKSEFRSVADLAHRHLVSLYELGCHDDLWFFTMERIEGTDLVTWLRGRPPPRLRDAADGVDLTGMTTVDAAITAPTVRQEVEPVHRVETRHKPSPPLSIERLRAGFGQLVRGVRALHAAGLLHLDLKPSNVLVERDDRVVVVDFGLVRALEGRSATKPDRTTIYGTPGWMAPEQYAGEAMAAATDWYAVGLMLYLALTGVPAFPSGSGPSLSFADISSPISPLELVPSLPADLAELAVALLRVEPRERPTEDAIAALFLGDAQPEVLVARRTPWSLVGREVERVALASAWSRACDRSAAVVHLVGPSGVGKSTLLDHLLERAKAGDAIVLRGRCHERESVPYKAFDGMLDQLAARLVAKDKPPLLVELPPWIAELSRLFPVLATVLTVAARLEERAVPAGVSALELRRRAAEALRELVIAIGALCPLVLAIDDLHWADADSLTLLAKLLEAPAPKGLLVATTFRAPEAQANPAVAAYLAAASADARSSSEPSELERVTLDVGPLPKVEAERLARTTLLALGVGSESMARAIANEAAGNPFYVEELAHYAAQRQLTAPTGATEDVALEGVLARRVESLAAPERALVEVLAVATSPIPLAVTFAVTGVEGGMRRALWSLRSGHFVRSSGSESGDRVELHHDGMRQAVLGAMSQARLAELHLALGRALRDRVEKDETTASMFAAVRHLASVPKLVTPEERVATIELHVAAGRAARRSAAFRVAYECFRAATELLASADWDARYELALAAHNGAAEAAYLSAEWLSVDRHAALVQAHGKNVFDQLPAREAQIDAYTARREYVAAVDAGLAALKLLGVELPSDPGEAEVGAELQQAMASLARVAPIGLTKLKVATDEAVIAAMRLQTRISSAAYFARPMLFPVLACRLLSTSATSGLSPATPYALAVYGIVLNSLGMLSEADTYGRIALELLERFDDRSLEARTRHVVHDLVSVFIPPLAGTLASLRAVVDIGKETGDLEFASYAAHAYVHNAFYASRELEGLLDEALALGERMRSYEQVNALHVHVPFEQVLRCFTGKTANPACLDGQGFSEAEALTVARDSGSRSAQCIVQLLMGIVRYHFGTPSDASEWLERARPFLDGVVSTWHTPIFHQYAALAIHALPPDRRTPLLPVAEAGLAALRALAVHGPANFAHRVELVAAESARAEGDLDAALAHCLAAATAAEANGFLNDLGLAHELAARCHVERRDASAATRSARAAGGAYQRWGAAAKTR